MCHQCIKAVDCHLLACTHHLCTPTCFPQEASRPSPPTTTTPEAKACHRQQQLPQTRILLAHCIYCRSDQYYSIGHSATDDALCLCVCVCVSLSLSLARASERAFWLAQSAPRERERSAFVCLLQRYFFVSLLPGGAAGWPY
jgi:hypothetical protein